MERRKVLTLLVQGGSAAVALVVGVPTVIYAVTAGRRDVGADEWRDLGPLDSFSVGEHHEALIGRSTESKAAQTLQQGVYVWRVSENQVIVFSRSCTDLGCPVTFDRGSECFLCPCHGGIFDKQGERMAGPPDRSLYRYETRVENGVLQVNLSSVPPMV